MSEIDIFVSSTGNFNISTWNHLKKLKNNAFFGNAGHSDDVVDLAGRLKAYSTMSTSCQKAQ